MPTELSALGLEIEWDHVEVILGGGHAGVRVRVRARARVRRGERLELGLESGLETFAIRRSGSVGLGSGLGLGWYLICRVTPALGVEAEVSPALGVEAEVSCEWTE